MTSLGFSKAKPSVHKVESLLEQSEENEGWISDPGFFTAGFAIYSMAVLFLNGNLNKSSLYPMFKHAERPKTRNICSFPATPQKYRRSLE